MLTGLAHRLTFKHADTGRHHGEYDIDIPTIAKNLRVGVSGASSRPLEIIRGIQEKYGISIMEGYGLSETCPVATFNLAHKERKPGSVGTPIWGIEVKVFDPENNEVPTGEVGEVVIRGHNVMKGYYNKPEAFKGTTWFHTGDLGRMDEDGYLFIVDRVKDMIIRGGFNVYPREVEEVLMTHPAVSLASVIGVPHDQHGEEIKPISSRMPARTSTPKSSSAGAKNRWRLINIRESSGCARRCR